ncbi:MAG: hypothetical protein VYC67_03870 [Pseudomonadota bacterium]|nr:hypothetical protein [Pseudomonadota bacterium]
MKKYTYIFLSLMLVTACSSNEVLNKLPANSDTKINISGRWVFDGDYLSNEMKINKTIDQSSGIIYQRIKTTGVFPEAQAARPKKNAWGVAHLFFKNAKVLRITQTDYALYVDFNRSIVEEYNFGELKNVTIGKVSASRSSGWFSNQFQIDTLDSHGMKITEKYTISGDMNTLTRNIIFRDKNFNNSEIVQNFKRESL